MDIFSAELRQLHNLIGIVPKNAIQDSGVLFQDEAVTLHVERLIDFIPIIGVDVEPGKTEVPRERDVAKVDLGVVMESQFLEFLGGVNVVGCDIAVNSVGEV